MNREQTNSRLTEFRRSGMHYCHCCGGGALGGLSRLALWVWCIWDVLQLRLRFRVGSQVTHNGTNLESTKMSYTTSVNGLTSKYMDSNHFGVLECLMSTGEDGVNWLWSCINLANPGSLAECGTRVLLPVMQVNNKKAIAWKGLWALHTRKGELLLVSSREGDPDWHRGAYIADRTQGTVEHRTNVLYDLRH